LARTVAELPPGARITDYISLGVITKDVSRFGRRCGAGPDGQGQHSSTRLPAQVVVYYVIALALYMQSSYREYCDVCWKECSGFAIHRPGCVWQQSGISQARTRLGWEPLQQLHDELVKAHRGAGYAWRLVSDLAAGEPGCSTFDVADEKANEEAFSRPGPAVAQAHILRFVSYPWWRTAPTCCLAARWTVTGRARSPWPKRCFPAWKGMLCLADRNFFGFELWQLARGTGADLLWRMKRICAWPAKNSWPMAPI